MARTLLGESDQDSASLSDAQIVSALDTFGWQAGMKVLAQGLYTKVSLEVRRQSEDGGTTTEWGTDRLEGLRKLMGDAEKGLLPDPEAGEVSVAKDELPGSTFLQNQPGW